jgi:hypothetical protein
MHHNGDVAVTIEAARRNATPYVEIRTSNMKYKYIVKGNDVNLGQLNFSCPDSFSLRLSAEERSIFFSEIKT